jgi:arginyl-tRNA synthetase
MLYMSIINKLKIDIRDVIKSEFGVDIMESDFQLAPPPDGQIGHFGTNAAMALAKPLKKAPFIIGEAIASQLRAKDYIAGVEVVKPGFVNITLKNDIYKDELARLLNDNSYFKNNAGAGRSINVEFVSANPVGPLNIVSGRAAAYGDTLANMLDYSGYKVTKETYVNDFGRQMHLFALSLMARYLQLYGKNVNVPEEGYQGEYVTDVAKAFRADKGEAYFETIGEVTDLEKCEKYGEFRAFGLQYILAWQKRTLENFGVRFDVWFSETTLHADNEVAEAFKIIETRGLFFEQEGAVWFRTTDFGDDKDRVVKKSDGDYTYFASDIAYMQNKIKRGADTVINILGPDHHGYVKRLESIMQGLGYDRERVKVLILQQVNLLEAGEKMKMSKRAGNFVSLDELLDTVGKDASRYFFLMRNYTSHLDFDLRLAKEQSDKNPVFYVQYAYARICSIFANAKIDPSEYSADKISLGALENEELEIIRRIVMVPSEICDAAKIYTPSGLVQSIFGLAGAFHTFYNKERVIIDDRPVMLKRLFLMAALKKTFEVCFSLIGITPREKM